MYCRFWRRLFILISVLAAVCLGYATVQAQGLVEAEPNNSFGDADVLLLNGATQGSISPAQDADWFEFVVDHHGELRLTVSDVAPELAVNLRVWNGDKGAITGWFAPFNVGGDTSAVVDLPAPGRYLLELAGGDSSQQSSDPYSLRADFTPSPDLFEPNNSSGAAAALTLGDPVTGALLPGGDADWYAFDIDQHGELRFTIGDVPEGLALNARVWNSNRDTITGWFSPLAKGGNTDALVDLAAPGRYYLEIAGSESSQRSVEPYTLSTTFTPSVDAFEANNSFGFATPLVLGESVDITLLPGGDADWFTFDVDHHGELQFSASGVPEELAVNMRVWNADRNTMTGWFSPLAKGGNTEAFVDLPGPGRYVLEVTGSDNSQRTIAPFVLSTRFMPATDPFEWNGRFGDATPLELNHSVPLNILPAGDSDWFQINAPHHGELLLQAAQVPQSMAVRMRVWNADKNTITGWFSPLAAGGNTTALVDLPAPGRYYIEVAGGDSSQRDIDAFLFTTRYAAAADQGEPNNDFDTATPVVLDDTIPANILPAGDRDWCEFEVDEPGDLHILVTNAAPELAISFRLWDSERRTISDWFRPLSQGGDVEAVQPIAEPGTYYIEVADNDGSARSVQPYLLRFSMEPIDPSVMALPEDEDTVVIVESAVTSTYAPGSELVVEDASLQGASVIVPANALPPGPDVQLQIGGVSGFDSLNVNSLLGIEQSVVELPGNLVAIGPMVSIEASGVVLDAPVQLKIPVDPDLAPDALGRWVVWSSDGGATWSPAPEADVLVDRENNLVTVLAHQFAVGGPVALVPESSGDAAAGYRDATPEEIALLKEMVSGALDRYREACFDRVIRLGDPGSYDAILDEIAVVIDPGYAGPGEGRMRADGLELTLKTPPAESAAGDAYGLMLWQELAVALIKQAGGPVDWSMSALLQRRDTAPQELAALQGILDELVALETETQLESIDPAAAAATIADLQGRWDVAGLFSDSSLNRGIFIKDLGVRADLDKIGSLYASGVCGELLEEAAAELGTPRE